MRLVEPSVQWEHAFVAMARDYAAAGEVRHALALADFQAYLRKLDRKRSAEGGLVSQTAFWLIDAERVIGCLRLRDRLTPALMDEGGKIGYDVRPSHRRLGWGTRMLRLGLDQARARGMQRVRITCDADNPGSIAIIERNGGVLSDEGLSKESGKLVRRYWIALSEP